MSGTAHSGGEQPSPRVSVLVTTHRGARHLRGCLDSLASQTLAPEQFEIVVVSNGLANSTPELVHAFRASHPALRVRLLELRETGAGRARNIGLASVRGAYVTFVDDDDRVTPAFLEALLAAARPDVVAAAMVHDVRSDGPGDDDVGGGTYIARGLSPLAGRVVKAQDLVTAFSYNAAKLVATELARSVAYDVSLRSGEDHVYWLALFSRQQFRFRVLAADSEALYLRTVRRGGVGSQPTSYDFNVTQRLECLAAIESVDRSDPAVASVAGGLMLAQSYWLNHYLLQHPGEHERVVQDARLLGLREVPWAAINRGLARDLALCYCFPPDLDTSGMVAARRLRERGLVTDVISHDLSRLRTVDPAATRVCAEVTDRTHVFRGPAGFVRWEAMTAFARDAWSVVERWEADQGSYRSVYSRAMAVNSHFAAALVKLRRPDTEWVAEFSDPLRINAVGDQRLGEVEDDWLRRELVAGVTEAGFELPDSLQVFDLAERITYALADRIVFTNQNQMDYMLGYCQDAGLVERALAISEVQHHPTLPVQFYELAPTDPSLDPAVTHIAYFGVFYPTRSLAEVLGALNRLGHADRARVQLHVFTTHPEALTLEVVRSGLAGVVRCRPFVPFLEYLHLTTKFDVLLVNDASTKEYAYSNPYLPSKMSDYLGSGTPVWALYEEGSVLSSLRVDYRSPLGDVDAALGILRQLTAGVVDAPLQTAGSSH
jgi:hypothetical protein